MNYTVSDFYHTFQAGMKIIAGSGGMSRIINDAGILDYEMDPLLKDKYFHSNFHENLLVVTTFSSVRDNPFRISDIVKLLIAKGISALVIKNVFHIPIPDSVLRYGDFKNFPIFIIESQNIFIENVIFEVHKRCELLQDTHYIQRKLDQILSCDLTDQEVVSCVKAINPSCREQFFNLYVKFDDYSPINEFDSFYSQFLASKLNHPGNMLIPYKDGFFFTYSDEKISTHYSVLLFKEILQSLIGNYPYKCAGISDYHLQIAEFKMSLHESLYAAAAEDVQENDYICYSDLGTYRFILPFAESREMSRYAADILNPIIDYDIENKTKLFTTLEKYLKLDCNLEATAEAFSLHRNTVRHRLDKITEISGLDYKKFSQLEQLSMALKIFHGQSRH